MKRRDAVAVLAILTISIVAFWWHARDRSANSPSTISPGLWIAIVSAVLTVPPLLLLQLGSPVPPYMDILATPAAAQRILTFGRYLPFDNDPYGYWGSALQ